jgi:hypothetical protein
MGTTHLPWYVILVPSVIIGLLVGFGMPKNPDTQSFTVTFPGGISLEMALSRAEISYSRLLFELFVAEPDSKDSLNQEDITIIRVGVLEWLRTNQHIYAVTDVALVVALEEYLCDPIPREPLQERVRKQRECADRPVAGALRDLRDKARVPFHYVGIPVRVGVPDEGRPSEGRASVCGDSGMLGRRVELINQVSGQRIEVVASGSYTCTGFSRYPDIQLEPLDARNLFNVPLQEYQDAIAVIIG